MIKILTIGNSFAGNATQLLPQIAAAGDSDSFMIGTCNLGGCSLEKHCNVLRQCELFPAVRPYAFARTGKQSIETTLLQALQAEQWDYVSLQQASRLSWQVDTYEPWFGQLMGVVSQYAPRAKVIIHQTWAYRIDAPFFAELGINQEIMHQQLTAAYEKIANTYTLNLIPVGNAFALARQNLHFSPDSAFDFDNPAPGALPDQTNSLNVGWRWITGNTPDGHAEFGIDCAHCSLLGHYLGAATWYERFSDRLIADNPYHPEQISAETLAVLKHAAHQAVISAGPLDR